MLYEWHWTTFILYCVMASVLIMGVRKLPVYSGMSHKNRSIHIPFANAGILYMFLFALLIILPVFRNLDMYPTYEDAISSGGRTIDAQTYVWQFLKGDAPGFHFKEMITMRQTEPILYLIAKLILTAGGDIKVVWLVVYSIIAICFLYFFSVTAEENRNYLLLFPVFYTYLYSMCAIRSGLSLAFFLSALACRKQKKYIAMIIMLFLGYSSHYVVFIAVVGLIFDAMLRLFKNKKRIIVVVALLWLSVFWGFNRSFYNVIATTKYSVYLDHPMTLIGQLPYILLMLVCIFYYNKIKELFPNRTLYVNLSIFNGLMTPVIIMFQAYRVNMYFMIPRIYTWGMILYILGQKRWFRKNIVIFNRSMNICDFIGGIIAFLWFAKLVYDGKGDGIMPIFNIFI